MDEPVVKWAWVHGGIGADTYETLDDAVAAAFWASDNGSESLACIEVIEVHGYRRIYTRDECDALMKPLLRAEEAEWKAQPKLRFRLRLQSPTEKSEWGTQGSYADEDAAWAEFDQWSELLGAERVRLELMDAPLGTRAVRSSSGE